LIGFPGLRRLADKSLLLAAAAVFALALAACGREESPDLVNGKTLFIGEGTCGSCHALARAGTKGTQGPDLDAAFAQAREDGMNEDTIEGIVHKQIGYPRRGSIMPADLVEGDDARDVAAYVAKVAGQAGEDSGALAEVGVKKGGTATAKAGVLEIDADETGALAFTASKAFAPPGKIELVMKNPSPIQHNIALEGGPEGPIVGTGETSRVATTLKPGKYVFLCTVPGHAEGGMKGDLTVK
jgi:mono/diheme cytochrome c family protein